MFDTTQLSSDSRFSVSEKVKNPLKLMSLTYENNVHSDYTEKIEALNKKFDYNSNKDSFWLAPEQSLLYGTPLYEASTHTQKLVLNHLHWVTNYMYIANSESEILAFNRLTANVFAATDSYNPIPQELELENEQESVHIRTFRNIGYTTLKAILGKEAFRHSLKHQGSQKAKSVTTVKLPTPLYPHAALRFGVNLMLKRSNRYKIDTDINLEAKNKQILIPNSQGFWGQGLFPEFLMQFLCYHWGLTPFLATNYYTSRYMANMFLKNQEHNIVKYHRKLEKQEQFIPIPTAISFFHFLDESFHTTTSLFLGRDLYRQFPEATIYEKWIANLIIYLVQQRTFSGLSATLPRRYFLDSLSDMLYVYKVAQSPVFEMSSSEALEWIEKCYCQEHQGWHNALKSHQHLLSELRKYLEPIDYLWPINKNMNVMENNGFISKAIKSNRQTFKKFSKEVISSLETKGFKVDAV